MNNRELMFLYSVLSNTPLKSFDEKIRPQLYTLKNNLEKYSKKYQNERIMIFLLNEGVEKTGQGGDTSIIMPEIPIRSKYTGSDEKYKEELQKILKTREKIENEIEILNTKKADIKIEKILTEEQFAQIGNSLNLPLDWQALGEHLIKK